MSGFRAKVSTDQQRNRDAIQRAVEMLTYPPPSESRLLSDLLELIPLKDQSRDELLFLAVEALEAAIEVVSEDDLVFEGADLAMADVGAKEFAPEEGGQAADLE